MGVGVLLGRLTIVRATFPCTCQAHGGHGSSARRRSVLPYLQDVLQFAHDLLLVRHGVASVLSLSGPVRLPQGHCVGAGGGLLSPLLPNNNTIARRGRAHAGGHAPVDNTETQQQRERPVSRVYCLHKQCPLHLQTSDCLYDMFRDTFKCPKID